MTTTQSTFFRVPTDRLGGLNYDAIARMLHSIPATWSYLSGWLIYPYKRMETPLSGMPVIATQTRLRLYRNAAAYHGVDFKPGTDELADHFPHYPEMAIYRPGAPWPRAVEFDEAGFGSISKYAHYTFEAAVDLAAHYIRECHYIGWIRCAILGGNSHEQTAATIRLRMTPGEGQEERGVLHPPRLWIEFDPRSGGTQTMVEPILTTCRELWKTEYTLGSNVVDAY